MEKDSSSSNVADLFRKFTEGFEETFHISDKGTLKCTKETRARAAQWFNGNKVMIILVTCPTIEDLEFEDSSSGDERTPVENKKKMLMAYAFAFTAYARYCQAINKEINSES